MGREKRRNNHYGLCCVAVISTLLTACGVQGESPDGLVTGEQEDVRELGETYSCSVREFSSYLHNYETDCPYVSADISISGYGMEPTDDNYWHWDLSKTTGDAEVTWQFYNSLEQMENELQMREENRTDYTDKTEKDGAEADEDIRLLYYSFPLPENAHALDIYQTLEERYGTQEQPVAALSGGREKFYYFMQETPVEDGFTHLYYHKSAINLIIIDGYAYALVPKNMPDTYPDQELNLLFTEYVRGFGRAAYSGWSLNEEDLYWIDHEERITVMEEPERRFVEVRGKDLGWGEISVKGYFGLLKEADYEVQLIEDGPKLDIHFSFAEDSLETEYETELIQGFCADENYNMTVTDKESGRILQEATLDLCIELPDTITFEDLNADGYVDMFIDKPLHSNSSRAVADKISYWYIPVYRLWNPKEEQFEYKTEKEVQNSLLANQNGLTEEEQEEKTKRERSDRFAPVAQLTAGADLDNYIELTGEGSTEYVVQPGDCLWGISERFLGSGFYWTTLQREENAVEDSDTLLPGEIVRIPGKIYIRRDPYSKGGLKSEGSFQIEQPFGFAHYFLAGDVKYNRWEEENQIHSLPVTNKMGENALSKDWEAFKAEVIRCSEEICPGKVSNLQFEKYSVKDGCDLYGYSFEYDAGDKIIEYTDFIRLSSANMVEVIGVREKEPNTVLLNTTRYIAASFVDYGGKPGMSWGGEVGPNVGADDWNYPLLHNLFTAAKEQFDS